MLIDTAPWLIMILPFLSFAVISVVIRPFFNRYAFAAGWITIGTVAICFFLSLSTIASVRDTTGGILADVTSYSWVTFSGMSLAFSFLIDPLTAIMLVVVSGVSLLIQIYSQGYMSGDRGYARYFAYMSLFTGAMLAMVMSRNIIQLFIFWELVGVASYLLIGFWFQRPAAAAAAKKAFIVTRIGDLGFLLAILYLFTQGGELLDIPTLYGELAKGAIASSVATWVALGIFAGAIGKSAQFPLHTWLPDAMEGPTPVSALIHSATMVTAGVFLVARFMPLFEVSSTAMNTVALIGGFTALFAATMALVSNDIKKVLAYSTVSQLGYMMLSLGLGIYVAAIFHLFTHAFFKALLFLGAGSLNHATGTFDMRYMGGLRRIMPITYGTAVIASLSLVGVFPLAGFWSKDEILSGALEPGSLVGYLCFILALITVALTGFYMARVIFMSFHGHFRGGVEAERGVAGPSNGQVNERGDHVDESLTNGARSLHLAESPMVMLIPMFVLASLSIFAGVLANPVTDMGIVDRHAMGNFLTENTNVFHGHGAAIEAGAEPRFNILVALGSSVLGVFGIVIAYLMYSRLVLSAKKWTERVPRAHALLVNKYYVDELYENLIVRRGFYAGLTFMFDKLDRSLIDNLNVRLSITVNQFGRLLARVQNGQAQAYALVIPLSILIVIGSYLIWGS